MALGLSALTSNRYVYVYLLLVFQHLKGLFEGLSARPSKHPFEHLSQHSSKYLGSTAPLITIIVHILLQVNILGI